MLETFFKMIIENCLRHIVLFIIIAWFVPTVQAQDKSNTSTYRIIRSNIGVGGSSKTIQTSKGKYTISQSIGQSSVIGTSSSNGYYLRQGFQQPHKSVKVVKSIYNALKATVYPNPADYNVHISFDEVTSKNITVKIFDIAGKLLYFKDFPPSKKIQLDLTNLSSGSYVLKAISNGKLFNSKLIKI
ncbi:Por secretion system C-terminal sorting domain-containing protein [Hyunsoonleella jejuensis]|uniref:Por secretion system C-terminal sorting domain-containing protein n=1 Tax=Hyunsoonleella jejuensis TaxID=419940 RepID=A0A1H9H4Y9_9FLAO|nr:T9SS type A sorting domain-containing protein [Hyunsoonleella jejuensis]SEQ57380.1 Por secretion system C-terminal sorting domain-containing protein [Hyunsoonleella jejuensis]